MRRPYLGHVLILASLLGSVAVARAVYVDPRARQAASLRAEAGRLEAEMADLRRGLSDMEGWKRAHPGRDVDGFAARHLEPARSMVSTFLRDLAPVADRWKVGTELIQSSEGPTEVTVTDAAGAARRLEMAELRFRLTAPYRALGEYLRDVESMDQLVVVRSVNVSYLASAYPALTAEVTIRLYGAP